MNPGTEGPARQIWACHTSAHLAVKSHWVIGLLATLGVGSVPVFPSKTDRGTMAFQTLLGPPKTHLAWNPGNPRNRLAYTVYNLTLQRAAPETYEQIGSKPKFWFVEGDDSRRSLFKFGRPGTDEVSAEKAAAEIAELMGLPHATIELAIFTDRLGTISPSFVDKSKGEDLIHGNEILSGRRSGYEKEKVRGQSEHRLDLILEAISELVQPEQRDGELGLFAGYLVLDALICNTDRHHENWGLIRRVGPDGSAAHTLAPTYDHASSLGRELLDERRQEILSGNRIEAYIRKGRGGIFLDSSGKKGENPLELVEKAFVTNPAIYRPWLEKLASLEKQAFSNIIGELPGMSPVAKSFCAALLDTTKSALGRLLV